MLLSAALSTAQQGYAVVFPEDSFGQIFEARHEPGTIAYSRGLQLQRLRETGAEIARNGCKKVIMGNNSQLPYFAQTQLEAPHDYVVYVEGLARGGPGEPKHRPPGDPHREVGPGQPAVAERVLWAEQEPAGEAGAGEWGRGSRVRRGPAHLPRVSL